MLDDLFIIKIGADTINDEVSLQHCIEACSTNGRNIILVHGGGNKVTEFAESLHIDQKMVEGRRITSAETMELCLMVYAGLFNKTIVAEFYKKGRKAAGVSGADFNCIISEKRQHPTIDYGLVGDVKYVDSNFFHNLIANKTIPVICSVTLGENGELFNTNADTMASGIAKAMTDRYNVHLVYCLEKNGVLTDVDDEDSALKSIDNQLFKEMKENKQIVKGMIPKLQNAFNVLNNGVGEVRIINSKKLSAYFDNKHPGTKIVS